MATTITASQLQQVQAALQTAQSTKTSSDTGAVWQLLSSFGDNYATAAYQAIAEPTSSYGAAVRNAWTVTGADFSSEFIPVALAHLQNYVNDIANSTPQNGNYALPTTTQIETSYFDALTANGVTPYAGIDLDMASMAEWSGVSSADWYNAPLVGI